MNTKTSNMNNKFNLNDLRSDAASYLTDQLASDPIIHHQFQMRRWCVITDLFNSTDFINLLDLIISALLGDFLFMAMYDDPALSFTTFDLGLSYPGDLDY